MNITLLTNEFPPYIYGGAGVHVDYLSQALTSVGLNRHQVEVLCFGDQLEIRESLGITGVVPNFSLPSQNVRHAKFLDTMARNLMMAGLAKDSQIIHCHTWYTHFAGCLLRQLLNIPMVLTTHSLEPHRPWKVEQLGNAYKASSWLEKTAYQNADGVIAISKSMQRDVEQLYGVPPERIRMIPNGISAEEFQYRPNPDLIRQYGIDPALPTLLFVGRITRQKGILHFLRAIPFLPAGIQVVLCAGMPDTPEIGQEMEALVQELRRHTEHPIHWIPKMLPKAELVAFYSQATLFVCPSVYEPFGLINLEAMACGIPVVATNVGGIPEVVQNGETGILVDVGAEGDELFEPKDSLAFSRNLAKAISDLLTQPELLRAYGLAGRRRIEKYFSWEKTAAETLHFYEEIIAHYAP